MKRVVLALCLGLATMGAIPAAHAHAAGFVGPRAYYLALGDSLVYGYQPNGTWNQGYADDFYANLRSHGTSHFTNLGCPGETSKTFMRGGCPYWYIRKTFYVGSQLSAALSFIKNHSGQVSPVTLDIGANDVLGDVNQNQCALSSTSQTDLATFNTNLTSILKQLSSALNGKGDLLVMNYYDPFQNLCGVGSVSLVDSMLQTMNSDIVADTAGTAAKVIDVYTPFTAANNICGLTWMCTNNDIHPTQSGYSLIAGTFESTTGY